MTEKSDPVEALRDLIKSYEALVYTARDRIIDLGGDCDPAPRMIADDPALLEARSALAAAESAGWVMVPKEITLEMQQAYFAVIDRNMERVETDPRFGRFASQREAYRAMIEAATAPANAE